MTTPKPQGIVAIDDLDVTGRLRPADPGHVRRLTDVLDDTPPVLVQVVGTQLWLLDGYMRVDAARALGRSTVRAELLHGDPAAGLARALRNNSSHGLPLTVRQRRDATLRLLAHAPDWTDRRIAEESGLDPKTVGRLRRNAARRSGAETPHVSSQQSQNRVGRDGRRYPPSAEELERRREAARQQINARPELSDGHVGREVDLSPNTVRRLRNQMTSQPQHEPQVQPRPAQPQPAAQPSLRGSQALVRAVLRSVRSTARRVAALFGELLRKVATAVRRTGR